MFLHLAENPWIFGLLSFLSLMLGFIPTIVLNFLYLRGHVSYAATDSAKQVQSPMTWAAAFAVVLWFFGSFYDLRDLEVSAANLPVWLVVAVSCVYMIRKTSAASEKLIMGLVGVVSTSVFLFGVMQLVF